jgi:1,4-dihydroxy-2-naphthoyl-CoA hydrolase
MTDELLDALPRHRWRADFEQLGLGTLAELLGISVVEIEPGHAILALKLRPELLLKTGFVHAGTVVSLADTSSGYGCRASLPEHAGGFTTMELKANLLASATAADELRSEANLVHGGRTTQVWDVEVSRSRGGRVIGLFRCTQMLLAARPEARP